MTKPIVLTSRGRFPTRPFKSIAELMWRQFFESASPSCDLALWEIEADSATVKLSTRCTSVDEDDPDWEVPIPVMVLVDGVVEALDELDSSLHTKLRIGFQNWVTKGVLESFRSAALAKKFRSFSSTRSSFAVATTPKDDGLSHCKFALIWTNDDDITPSTIAARQRAAKQKRVKRKGRLKKVSKKRTKK